MSTDVCKWLAQHGHGVFVPAVARSGVDMSTLARVSLLNDGAAIGGWYGLGVDVVCGLQMSSWDLDRIGVPPGLHRSAMLVDLQRCTPPADPSPCDVIPWSPPERAGDDEDRSEIRSPVVDRRLPHRRGTDPDYDGFGSRVSRPTQSPHRTMKSPVSFQKKPFVDLTVYPDETPQRHSVAFKPGGDDVVEINPSARAADTRLVL